MKVKIDSPLYRNLGLLLAALIFGPLAASATTFINTNSGNWGISANWTGGGPSAPGASDAVIQFSPTATDNSTNDLGGVFWLNQLVLVSNKTVTLYAPSGNSLLFTNTSGGVLPVLTNANNGTLTINSPITLATNLTVSSATNGAITINSNITQSAMSAIIKTGTNTLTLSGANTFTGGVVIKAGAAILGNTNGAGTGIITIGDSGGGANTTLQVGGGVNATYPNPISVASGNNGVATININPGGNGNSVSGPITLNNHDLFVNANVGYGSHTMTGGFTGTGNLTFGGIAPLTIGAVAINGSITNNMSNVLTISGNIGSNVTAVVQNSTSSLVLSGTNAYTGPTVVSAGTLQVNGNNALGTGVVNFPTGTGTLKAGIPGLVVTNNLNITGAAATMDTTNNYIALGSAIGGPGSLTKTGTGTLILSGLSSYGGATTISQGTLRLAGAGSALGNIMPTGDSITYGLHGTNAGYRGPLYNLMHTAGYFSTYVGSANANSGSLPTTPLDQTHHEGHSGWNIAQVLNGVTPIAQGGLGWMSANPQILTLLIGINDRNLTTATDVSMVPGLMGEYGSLIDSIFQQRPTVRLYVGKLTPANGYDVYVNAFNASLVTLVNAKQAAGDNIAIVDLNSNFPTTNGLYDGIHPNDVGYAWMAQQWFNAITADHPVVFSANVLPATTAVSLASGATLDLGGVSQTIASLSDSGGSAVTNSYTVIPVTLTINPPAGSATYSGKISDSGISNAISLVKSGAGTQVFAGTNTFSGSLTNSGGTLTIGGAGLLGNGNYAPGFVNNAAFNYASSASQTLSGVISGSGSLTNAGTGTLTLTGTNTYSGATTISAGTLALSGRGSFTNTASIVVASNAIFNVSGLTNAFTLAAALSSQTLSNSAPGAIINGTNNCSAGTVSLVYDGVNPSFIQTNGGMTLSSSTTIKVNNTGAAMGTGNYLIISNATAGLVAGAVSASPVTVGGNGAAGTATMAITGGALYVNVGSSLPATGTNVSFGVTNNLLTLSWPANYTGWQLWSNSVNLANTSYWFQVTGATGTNRVNIPINPTQANVFYRLQHP